MIVIKDDYGNEYKVSDFEVFKNTSSYTTRRMEKEMEAFMKKMVFGLK